MHLDRQWTPKVEGDFKDIVSTDNRRVVMNAININKSNFVNYLRSLYDRRFLIKNDNGGTEINPFFMVEPDPESGSVEINIILNCYDGNEENKEKGSED